ncbi:MAG TPA: hypothetical protein VFN62_00145, partial [Acidobacteriaceae bacterium]|nr:hypothetical protein [Acidobacteriaceae bacterium]
LLRLMLNTIQWITADQQIVDIQGEGFIEALAWETTPGYAIHVLNYTNPNSQHCWLQASYPIGPQTVRMQLPHGVGVKSVELLRAGRTVPFHLEGEALQFTIPSVADYEVAAITVA